MFHFIFLEDVARLYRHGLLLGACSRTMRHPVILLYYAVCAVIYFLDQPTARNTALLGFALVLGTSVHAWDCIVTRLTPLCFGTFLIGRLNWKLRNLYLSFRSEFTLIPSAEQLLVLNMGSGTEGLTYLLIQHPTKPSIVRPIIDDDPSYMKDIMAYATDERRMEILAEIARLRRTAS